MQVYDMSKIVEPNQPLQVDSRLGFSSILDKRSRKSLITLFTRP